LNIKGINGRLMFQTWYQVQELLTSGKVDIRPLITHTFPLVEFDNAMQLLLNKEAVKIVLYPESEISD